MLLCISMIAALCGISAFAEDAAVAEVGGVPYTSLKEAFNAATTGSTVKLLADATVSKSGIGIMNGKAVTLDLNGHNITNNGCGVFQIYNNGKLDVTGTGKIETTGSYLPFIVQSNITNSEEKIDSVLTIGENVEVISNDYCAIFYIGNGAVVNVRGTVNALGEYAAIQGNGQYSVKDDNNWGRTTLNIYPGAVVTANTTTIYHPQFGGEVNVTGGVITSKDACAIEMRAGKLNVSGDAVIETKATKFEYASNNNGSTTKGAAVAAALYQDRIISINISGGTYKGVKALSYENPNSVVNPDVTINVTGGTFSTDITEALSNEEVKSNIADIKVVTNDDGTYTVRKEAAKIGETIYESLEAAFKAAEDGNTITLLANAKVYSRININNGKKLTLDLGNFNIDNEHSDRLFYVKDGALTVTGQGTVTNNNNDVFVVCGNSNATTWATTAIDSVLTIGEKVKVVSGGDCCIFWQGNGAVANVYGDLTSNGIYATIQGNGSLNDKTNNGGTVLNIFPGASVKATSTATTIYHPQSGTVNVTGGTIDSAEGCGIEMRDGTLNISGDAAVISHADKYESDPNGNGATTVGAAVAIAMYGNGNRVGVLNISGGTFKGVKALSYANPNKVANPDVTITVTGGTFSTDITDALTNAEVKSNIADIKVVTNDDGTYTVRKEAAKIGETIYESLEAAFKAAEDGSTITLLSDDTVNNQIVVTDGKAVTLDLGGHNVTSSDSITPFLVTGGELKVTGNGTVTSKLITFRTKANTDPSTMNENPLNSVLTIDKNVTVVSNDMCAVYHTGSGSKVNVYGTLESHGIYATIQGNGTINDKEVDGGTVLNIFTGAVVKASKAAITIYHPQGGTVNITGGTIENEEGCGIEMRDGTLNISGDAAVISHAGKYESDPNGSGSTTVGAAVAIAMYGNGNRAAKLNISGGTFKGVKAIAYSNPNKVVNPDVTITVTGGTFSTDITDALTNAEVKSNIKEYAVAANDDGTYGVKARDEKFEKVAAVQRGSNNTLTFLAGINYLDYEKAGFRVAVGNNTTEIDTDTVYTELNNKGTTSVSTTDFSTNYFFAANFEVTDTTIEAFTITPFAKLLNGEVVTGKSTTVKVEKTGGAE